MTKGRSEIGDEESTMKDSEDRYPMSFTIPRLP
jgi:hypothetical protein